MNSLSSFFFLAALTSLGHAQDSAKQPLTAVPDVDLKRYVGTWYEIARLPNSFQEQCVGDVTATYSLLDDGDILVINRCRKENGQFTEAKGHAKLARKEGPTSKLKVRFAPAFLSFLPFVWGNYWIIILAPDYTYAVIGEPDRKYLWILSRTPSMEEATFNKILEQVQQSGYDSKGLMRTKNSEN